MPDFEEKVVSIKVIGVGGAGNNVVNRMLAAGVGGVDFVVVNAGTNDCGGGVTDEEFHDGAKAFLLDLRSHYPTAKLVWYYGLMGLRYDAVLRALETELAQTEAAFSYLSVRPISRTAGEIGAVWHPSVEGDERGAAVLAAHLHSLS